MADSPELFADLMDRANALEFGEEAAESPRAKELRELKEGYRAEEASLRDKLDPGALVAGVQGAEDALFGPLSSIGMTPEQAAVRRRTEENHKIASAAGEIVGYVGGALGGVGIPGLLQGAGRAAAKGAALGLGKAGLSEGVSKGAGFILGSAIEGGGIALSEASGKSALDRAIGIPGSGMQLADTVGRGMAFGGAAGVLGVFIPKTANFLFKGAFKDRIAQLNKAKEAGMKAGLEDNALTARLGEIEKSMTPDELARLREFSAVTRAPSEYDRIIGTLGAKPAKRIKKGIEEVAEGSDEAIDESINGALESGRPLTKVLRGNESLDPGLLLTRRAIKRADDAVESALGKALKDVGDSTRTGILEAAIDGAMLVLGGPGAYISRRLVIPSIRLLQNQIYKGLMHLPPIRYAMSASLHAGKLSLNKQWRQGAKYVHMPNVYDKYIDSSAAMIKAMRLPALAVLTKEEYQDVSDELIGLDPAKLEWSLRSGMAAKGIPQEAAGPAVDQFVRTMTHVSSKFPQPRQPTWSGREGVQNIPQSTLLSISKTLRSSFVPATVLEDLASGRLTREAAESWWATQPEEITQMVASELRTSIALAEAHGRVFTAKEKQQFGLMMDPSMSKLGRTKDFNLIQSMQGNYVTDEASVPPAQLGGPRPPGDPKAASGLNQSTVGPSQALTSRLNRR